jgi:pyruvate dehydrogenase E1 component
MNENYIHPSIPKGVSNGILKGMYRLKRGGKKKLKAQLMGSGTILREVLASSEILLKDFGVDSDVWSVTSFNELRRNALQIERWNNLNPDKQLKKNYIQSCLSSSAGPFIAATDYMKIIPDQIQRWVPGTFISLGTDGYGRSDTRSALRKHFEVDRWFIVITTLKALSDQGMIDGRIVSKAIKKYGIDPSKKDPVNL